MNNYSENPGSGGSGGFGGFGGQRLRFGPGGLGEAIKWIIIVNVVIYLIQQFVPLNQLFGLIPGIYFSEDFPNGFYKPFTYMFLHGGFMHILFNMLVLWMFGTELEKMWGTRKFLRYYLLSGIGGAIFSLIFDFDSNAVVIGASGAVYGIMAAYWRYFPQRKLYLYFFVPIKVLYAIPAFLLIPLLWSLFSPGGNVAHFAHLGGAVFGYFLSRGGATVDSGIPSSSGTLKSWLKRRKSEKLNERFETNRRQAGDVMKRVDAILDKINEVGIENITNEERKFLQEASERLSEDKKPN